MLTLPSVQSFRKKRFSLLFASLFLLGACTHLKVQKTETQHAAITEAPVDSVTYKLIRPYKQALDEKMSMVIGYAPVALTRDLPESNLGNFFADVMMQKAKTLPGTDTANLISIFNTGGLRTSVPSGDIHVGNMYELMPFENELVLMPLKGSELISVLNVISDKGGAPVAGIRFEIYDKKPGHVMVHKNDLDTAMIYTIVTSDYLANGGDYFFSTTKPKEITKTSILLRDILIEHCKNLQKQNKPVTATTDGRISVAK